MTESTKYSGTVRNELAQVQLTRAEKTILIGLAGIHTITTAQYLRSLISEQYKQHTEVVDKWVSENTLATFKTPAEKAVIREAILERYSNGETAINLANEFGYSRGAVYAMVQRHMRQKTGGATRFTDAELKIAIAAVMERGEQNTAVESETSEGEPDGQNPLNIKWE